MLNVKLESNRQPMLYTFYPLHLLPSTLADLMYAALPAGLLCDRKHASFFLAPAVQERAARCGNKSLIILLKS